MNRRFGWVALVCLSVMVACSDDIETGLMVDEAAAASVPDNLTIGLLDQTVVAYAECLSDDFRVAIRYRPERYSGVDLGLKPRQGEEFTADVPEPEQAEASCAEESNLTAISTAYQQRNPLTPSQEQQMATEYADCLDLNSPDTAGIAADLISFEEVVEFHASVSEIVSINVFPSIEACFAEAVFGPMSEF